MEFEGLKAACESLSPQEPVDNPLLVGDVLVAMLDDVITHPVTECCDWCAADCGPNGFAPIKAYCGRCGLISHVCLAAYLL